MLGIHRDERRIALLLFTYSFFISILRNSVFISAEAIFLEHYQASDLSYVFILTAFTTFIASTIYIRLGRSFTLLPLVCINLSLLLFVALLLRVLLEFTDHKWPAMALAVWAQTQAPLSIIAFWTVASSLLNVRQGKRLFPIVSVGGVISAILLGLSIPPLARSVGNLNLIFLAVPGGVPCLLLVFYLGRSHREELDARASGEDRFDKKTPQRSPQEKSYFTMIIFYITLSYIVYYFVYNGFNDAAQLRYSDATERAGFFGIFFAVSAFGNFTLGLVFGRLINRFGLIFGLIILPCVTLLGTTLTGLSSLFTPTMLFVFWFMISTRTLDRLLRNLCNTSMVTLYQPLANATQVQAAMQGVVFSLVTGLSGLLLLLLESVGIAGAAELSLLLIPVSLLWIGVTIFVRRGYIGILGAALMKRKLNPLAMQYLGGNMLALLEKELTSENAEKVVYALKLLEENSSESLPRFLTQSIEHPALEVRRFALQRIESCRLTELIWLLENRLDNEPAAELRGELLQTLCALSPDHLQLGMAYLEHSEVYLRMGAIVGLLRSGSIEGMIHAGSRLLEMLKSDDSQDLIFAANVLGAAGISNYYGPILELLHHHDYDVRRAALFAAQKLNNPLIWPIAISNLKIPELRASVSAAIVAAGESAIPALIAAFRLNQDNPGLSSQILRLLGFIGREQAIPFLEENIGHQSELIRHQVMTALKTCRYQAASDKVLLLKEQLTQEARAARQNLTMLADSAGESGAVLFRQALQHKLFEHRERIFLLLSFVYDRTGLLRALDNYTRGDRKQRAYALEFVENTIALDLRRLLLPVLEDTPAGGAARESGARPEKKSVAAHLRFVLEDPRSEAWLTAAALHAVGRLGLKELTGRVSAKLGDANPLVQETALETMAGLDFERVSRVWERFEKRALPGLAKQVKSILSRDQRRSTIEKIEYLRSVFLFRDTQDSALAEIVPALDEVFYEAGQFIFEEGTHGEFMYIIQLGEVEVLKKGRSVVELGPGEVFGEFSVLLPRKHTASIRALVNTGVFRLHREVLQDLIARNGVVAKGLIQSILYKTRSQLPKDLL